MATIQDVAAAAGVSVATVSRVINNAGVVSPKTLDKVNAAITKLAYTPNGFARDLRKAESRYVLVLLQTISNPFYATIVKGIEDVAHSMGYHIILSNTSSDMHRERDSLELLNSRVVGGAILIDAAMDIQEICNIGAKNNLVLCCECRDDIDVTHVQIDNYMAAKTMVKHLLSLGHRDIALIIGDADLSSTKLRYDGYRDAMTEAGITVNNALVYQSECSSYKCGMRALEGILQSPTKPTALFAMSDVLAIGAIKAMRSKGIRVPEDIAVAGFDGIDMSEMVVPGLTTISQPTYDIGCTAMKLLLEKMKNSDAGNRKVVLEHSLIIRESTIPQYR